MRNSIGCERNVVAQHRIISTSSSMLTSSRAAAQAGLAPDAPLPSVLDLPQAAKLLGLGRTTAYRLVHDQQWPTPVLRLGRLIKIPTQPLLDLLAGAPRNPPDVEDDAGDATAFALRAARPHATR
jgi:excisionase family DNA binding protein